MVRWLILDFEIVLYADVSDSQAVLSLSVSAVLFDRVGKDR
jgi:hypothetical protein